MKDETLLPDEVIESLEMLTSRNYFREWIKTPTGYVAGSIAVRDLVNVVLFADACRAALPSGNSGQLNRANSFTDDDLDSMTHGDNPVANAYRELLEFRRNAACGNSGKVPAGYVLVPIDATRAMIDAAERVEEDGYDAMLKAMIAAAPAASDGWIPVSERLPPLKTGVLVATEMDGPGDWRMKWATRVPEHPDAINGWLIPGASWTPSHWHPLPDAPKVKP
ncbi:MAG: DUF551 domain-containing protein [Enterobacteriaceae bacterium]|nr:DUF551 domain-containing protein [Enterobacteriaceae bacterium]